LAKYHSEMGHEVHVICSNRTYPKQREYKVFSDVYNKRIIKPGKKEVEDFTIHYLPAYFEVNMQLFLKGLFKKLKEIKPDIIFAHGLTRWTTISIVIWKKVFAKNVILIVDDHMQFSAYFPKFYRKVWYLIFKNLIRFLLPVIDQVIAISNETKKFLNEMFFVPSQKITVIPLGVDCEKFNFSDESRRKIREKLGIPENAFVIIYAGKIVPEKGCDLVYEISKDYLKNKHNVYLLYVGSGIESQFAQDIRNRALNDGVGNRVLWHSHVDHSELPAFFSAADVAIWPYQETMSILQAAACGLPVILRNSDIAREYTAGGNGFACATIEEQKIALGQLIDNSALRKEMGEKGVKYMRERFCWRKIAEQFIEVALLHREKYKIKMP
jgi:glycosyltransferase involved in cell wall biosynthesis